MKKLYPLLLSALLCLACVLTFAACDKNDPDTTPGTGTDSATEAPTEAATDAPGATEAPDETAAPADTTADTTVDTADETETTVTGDIEYDPETYVVIRTAEDLMAFNKSVNEDGDYYDDMTVIFLDDIDMTGYIWTPLDGNALYGVTFDGQGHTVSNMEFATHDPEPGTPASEIGCGFVGINYGDLTFQDITFDQCHVTAYERAVACLVGLNRADGGYLWFENVNVTNFTADGWMDYDNQNRDNGGHPISFRLAGFVGHNMAGSMGFENCKVEKIKLFGFHNLAGFIGYEGTGNVNEFCFEGCQVIDAEFTFSYCMSEYYTVDMPRKFVSVFYNAGNWADNIDQVVELGNAFSGVSFYDYTDNNAEYTPSDFRSWTREEAVA